MEERTPIKYFTDLTAWQQAHELALLIYKVIKKFPIEERYALADQMRRSCVSIPSNIAEGFARNTAKDKNQFYSISKGSLNELHSQLFIARDLDYIQPSEFRNTEQKLIRVSKLISGLIKFSVSKP